jgi:lipoprotein-anchoring transpeptidase ErfK/SrfK
LLSPSRSGRLGEMGSKTSGSERDEVISVLFLALLFVVVLAGREMGRIYSDYQEVSQLAVVFQLGEEEIAGYLMEVLTGASSELEVGVALTLPSLRNVEGIVTQLPDYARRWLISVTLSPIVVRQPEVSDIEVALWVEGEALQSERFGFEREEIPYISLLDRSVTLIVEDVESFKGAVTEGAERYGGEVEVRFTGRALVHLLFLKTWLPFSTTRYPLVRVPHVEYLSSGWTDTDGRPITSLEADGTALVQFRTSNPTRVHSIHENVTAAVYREGSEEPVYTTWKIASVAPSTTATYVFQFTPEEPGAYRYSLEVADGFELPADESPSLLVEGG